MNTSNPWDHLPNAAYIDRIILSEKLYPDFWDIASRKWDNLIGLTTRVRAYNAAEEKCKELGLDNIWLNPKTSHGCDILALIVYDNCAYYLEYTSQELTTVALLGVDPAIMLLPAVIAFEEIAKISH